MVQTLPQSNTFPTHPTPSDKQLLLLLLYLSDNLGMG